MIHTRDDFEKSREASFFSTGNITLVLQRILNVRVETSLALDETNNRQPIIYDSSDIEI